MGQEVAVDADSVDLGGLGDRERRDAVSAARHLGSATRRESCCPMEALVGSGRTAARDSSRDCSDAAATDGRAWLLNGTGSLARLDGWTAAGKTGSAQKIDPSTGRYSPTNFIASFTGFAPVNNPAVVILVSLDSPVGLHEGGQVAAPVFKRIAEQVLAVSGCGARRAAESAIGSGGVQDSRKRSTSARSRISRRPIFRRSPMKLPVESKLRRAAPAAGEASRSGSDDGGRRRR